MLNLTIVDCDEVINATIEDGVKGDKGDDGPPVPVAQELGDDPDLAVSQKLLKDSIDSMEQSNSEAVAEAERLNNLSQQAASSAAESELNASASAESANSSALSADQSASESEASAEQSLQSASRSESSAQSAASSAQSASESASSAGVSAEQASLAAVAADDSASKAKQSELSAIGSAERSEAGANSASSSATQAEQSAQSAASSAQSATDSADLAAASALAAKASEDSAKGSAEQAESSAKRADAAAETVEDKFDKSKVVGELGDRDDLVINQARVTLELNTLYRQIELLTAWSGHEIPKQPLYADFIGQRYAKDGKPCRFEDIFELTRLSKAWQFEGGKLEDYEVNEPRFSGKGLLIEGEVTNYLNLSNFRNDNIYRSEVSDGVVVVESLTDKASSLSVLNTAYPTPTVTGDDVYRLIIAETPKDTMIGLGGTTGTSSIITKDGERVDSFNVPNGWASYEGGVHRLIRTKTVATGQLAVSILFGSKLGSNGLPVPLIGEKVRVIAATATTGAARIKDFSPIGMSESANTTRLPETLTVLTDSSFTIEADEGIQVNGNEISGFGYIRKLEVK